MKTLLYPLEYVDPRPERRTLRLSFVERLPGSFMTESCRYDVPLGINTYRRAARRTCVRHLTRFAAQRGRALSQTVCTLFAIGSTDH